MRKVTAWLIACIILLILIIVLSITRFSSNGGEDTWIKDVNGVYVKHGNPLTIPVNVKAQQDAIACAIVLYTQEKLNGTQFDSQCLGTCYDYAIDIVHVPRTADDNKQENQCSDFINGKVNNFIELNQSGEIVRIVE